MLSQVIILINSFKNTPKILGNGYIRWKEVLFVYFGFEFTFGLFKLDFC